MRYVSKPQEVEAFQYGPEFREGLVEELAEFIAGRKMSRDQEVVDFVQPTGDWDPPENPEVKILAGQDGAQGWVPVPLGHWVVRKPGDLTDHWPVDPIYFAGKYEPKESWDG